VRGVSWLLGAASKRGTIYMFGKYARILAGASILACLSQNASAYIGPIAGEIGTVEVIGSGGGAPGNFDFRIFFANNPVICNGQAWAYINTSDVNYGAMVSSLLTAKALGSSVTIYVNQDARGFCQLAYIGAIN
jgi:hypothetical protein